MKNEPPSFREEMGEDEVNEGEQSEAEGDTRDTVREEGRGRGRCM
jgi:hypothetical protein